MCKIEKLTIFAFEKMDCSGKRDRQNRPTGQPSISLTKPLFNIKFKI